MNFSNSFHGAWGHGRVLMAEAGGGSGIYFLTDWTSIPEGFWKTLRPNRGNEAITCSITSEAMRS